MASARVRECASAEVASFYCGSNVGPISNRTCPVGNRTYGRLATLSVDDGGDDTGGRFTHDPNRPPTSSHIIVGRSLARIVVQFVKIKNTWRKMRHLLGTPTSPSASLRTKPTRTSALPGSNLLMTQKTRNNSVVGCIGPML